MAVAQKLRKPPEAVVLQPPSARDMTDDSLALANSEDPLLADSTLDAESFSADPDRFGESRHDVIARAAYFLAEARGFEHGHELDDWLAAERQTDVE